MVLCMNIVGRQELNVMQQHQYFWEMQDEVLVMYVGLKAVAQPPITRVLPGHKAISSKNLAGAHEHS